MVYIYKKSIGNKNYYYLRASVKAQDRLITKDIAYLGNNIKDIQAKLDNLSPRYKKEIRKTYSTINKFIEANYFLDKIESKKLKKDDYLTEKEKIEACALHWRSIHKKRHKLTQKDYLDNFIVDFAFNTTSQEGNTITLKETYNLLMQQRTPKNKSLREIYDLKNTEKVFFDMIDNKEDISHRLICKIHDNLLENIDDRKGYRTADVRVFRSRFKSTPFQFIKDDIDILLKWYKENKRTLHPFVLAIAFYHKFEKIHPFFDGNGRTGRILLNYILLQDDYPPIVHKKKYRESYLRLLSKADEENIDSISLIRYKDLIGFSAKEYYNTYWNTFL